jgi:putative transferase (TIGR04331 family)
MASRFLCTTALEQTWRDDRPLLFLGEWCRRFARREQWSKLDAEVLPYHWDDRTKLYNDYRYLQGFYERLLPEIAARLNEQHEVDHGLRYWRILVGPWLGYFVQILFDRWASIHQSVRDYDLSGTVVLVGHEADLVPNDAAEFQRFLVADSWNHHIYAAVLQRNTDVSVCVEPGEFLQDIRGRDTPRPWSRRVRETLISKASRVAGVFVGDQDALLHFTGLSVGEEMGLGLRLGQMPQLWRPEPAPQSPLDGRSRDWVPQGESRSSFEAFARTMIPAQMPKAYLEGYGLLREQAARQPWPEYPKLIWTSHSQYSDEIFKAWAADKAERGAPLVIGQHGGHMGVGRWSFIEEHDVAISDRYLSWGWSDTEQPKVTPVCHLKPSPPLRIQHSSQKRALMVAVAYPRFSYCMFSGVIARQWLDYFENQCAFVEQLPGRIRDCLTIRLYPDDFGWDQAARWRDRFSSVRLDEGQSQMKDLIRGSRLYISTYNATTYLQSIAMEVPTVIFWDPKSSELRDAAQTYFDELRRVGIFHHSAESAAAHVAGIWDDVDGWWCSTAVREVLARFADRYCRTVPNVAACVEPVLRKTIAAATAMAAR